MWPTSMVRSKLSERTEHEDGVERTVVEVETACVTELDTESAPSACLLDVQLDRVEQGDVVAVRGQVLGMNPGPAADVEQPSGGVREEPFEDVPRAELHPATDRILRQPIGLGIAVLVVSDDPRVEVHRGSLDHLAGSAPTISNQSSLRYF